LGKIVFATKETHAPKPKKEKKKKDGSKKGNSKKGKEQKQQKKKKPAKPLHWSKTLPASKMSLDATKKLFFNKRPYNEKFFEEFWPTFDAEGYVFMTQAYNYDDENNIFFQAQNLLGGFLQRAESCRKYAFGVIMLVGTDEETPPYKVRGCWCFRGKDMLPEMKDHVSAEYYTWKKTEDRELIKKYFMADDVPDGKILDRRFFK